MKYLIGLISLLVFSTSMVGQYNITFDIDNYDNDTTVVGYYIMDKQLVLDTLYRDGDVFVLQGEDTLDAGTYLLLTKPDNKFVQFLVSETETEFKMRYDYDDPAILEFHNAPDNQAFQDYVSFLSKKRPEAEKLRDTISKLQEQELPYDQFTEALDQIDKDVLNKQNEIINANPDFLSSITIKANQDIEVPDFEDAEEPGFERFKYYRTHYFDNMDLSKPALLRSPFLYSKIKYYMDKLTATHPDSISRSMDYVLGQMGEDSEAYRYYLSHYLNEYANTKVVGYDAVYVHLVDKYYAQGKAPWVEEDNLLKIVDRAYKIRPTLIGKTGADLKLYKQDSTAVMLSELDCEYLVLFFWAPECGHCTKSMPALVEFNDKWKDKGVKTVAICNKLQTKTKNCWDAIEGKDMLRMINLADQYHESRFKIKYNVSKTPKIFVMDKNREILIKDIGAEQLDKIIDDIIALKKAEEEEGNE